jgi:predicted permease
VRPRLSSLRLSPAREAEIVEELSQHLDDRYRELIAGGASPEDATRLTLADFRDGNLLARYLAPLRQAHPPPPITPGGPGGRLHMDLGQDLRYAARTLWKQPGFTAAALLTLALGIGANTAVFSVVRAVLLEPLPFADADRIVRIYQANPSNGIERGAVSEPDFLDWRRASQAAETMGAFWYVDGLSGLDLTGAGNPERLAATLVTDGFFQTLGSGPLFGRTFLPADHVPGRDRVVVISHGLWVRRFGADASIVGRSVTLNKTPFQVVGVMPPAFTYPANQRVDAWIPLSFFGPDDIGRARGAFFLAVVARLVPGVTEAQLRSELSGVAERLSREYPDNPGWSAVNTAPIRDTIVGEVRKPLIVLMAAVGMLLLIACVNIAGLLLARASVRQPELAVRAALGASRSRIARQLVTESLALALLGGALGIALGVVAVRAFTAWSVTGLPRAGAIEVDGLVLAFTLGLSVASGFVFGVVPAWRVSRNLEQSLRSGSRASVGGTGQRLRSALVVVEVGLAVVLVAGAALAAKSFARLLAVDPGFRPSNALVVMISVPSPQHYVAILDGLRAVPGVEAVGSIRDLPLQGKGELVRPAIAGRPTPPGGNPPAQRHHVSVDYFKAMGIPLRAGRAFEPADRADSRRVVIVNEEFARRAWPGEDAIGKALGAGQNQMPVIGVVADVRQGGLAEPVEPAMYLAALQQFRSRMTIVVRTSGDPLRYADPVRRVIWSQNPDQTITAVTTLDAVMGRGVAQPRVLAWLLGAFGAIGLTLGALGIFGVLAYAVTQRRREIGVRLALGASPRAVLRLILGQGMVLAVAGVTIGAVGAAILTRSMEAVLFGIEPSDPWTFVQVIAVLLGAAALASWLPARRALAIDPVTALRCD